MRCRAVLLDLDGVLVESRACIERHWKRWAKRHGLDVDAVLAEAHGRRTIDTIRAVAPELDARSEARALDEAEVADGDGVVALPGAANLLGALPEHSWAIVTSGTRALALARLGYAQLPVPRRLVSADDVREGKPHPACYTRAAELLSISPGDCVVFEDALAGIAAAHAASMRVIAVGTRDAPTNADVRIDSLAAVTLIATPAGPTAPASLELRLEARIDTTSSRHP